MRRCVLACWLIAALSLSGCQLVDWLYKKENPKSTSVAETIQSVANSMGPIGQLVSLAIGLGGAAYGGHRHVKHSRVVKENHQLRAKIPPSVPPGGIPPAAA